MSNFDRFKKFGNIPLERPIYNPFYDSPEYGTTLSGGSPIGHYQPTLNELLSGEGDLTGFRKTVLPVGVNVDNDTPIVVTKDGEIKHGDIVLNNSVSDYTGKEDNNNTVNNLTEKGKDFIKNNPVLSVGLGLGLVFILFGNKNNKK